MKLLGFFYKLQEKAKHLLCLDAGRQVARTAALHISQVKNVPIDRKYYSVSTSTVSGLGSYDTSVYKASSDLSTKNFKNNFIGWRNLGLERASAKKFMSIWERHKNAIQKMHPNDYGFKKIPCTNRDYYINKDNKVIYRGIEKRGGSGTFKIKKYGAPYEEFVGLVPQASPKNSPPNDFKKEAKEDNSDLTRLNLKAVILNVVVEDQLIISRNAGIPVNRDYSHHPVGSNNIKSIGIEAFYNALDDLTILHENNIYLRDIKPENMAFDYKKNKINFIDVDDRIQIRSNRPYEGDYFYTPQAITKGLIDGAYTSKNAQVQRDYFKTADEYAFLLSLIFSTTENDALAMAVSTPRADIESDAYRGVMNSKNVLLFEEWINQHIKSDFHYEIKALLRNPAAFAQRAQREKAPYLADMIL